MAFMISQSQQSLSSEDKENQTQVELGPISTQLHLISSSSSSSSHSSSSSKALDKEVILRRIRHHKSLNKLRNVFQALAGSSEHVNFVSDNSAGLDLQDVFSCP
ncbi:conserved hypothetical protein [Ricinus communis]|uniref:Uncharacterized protein n=1 Tax=Ricinus communis TaxID=3988 RepID=B9S8Q7_RICCO|nr:conserved hypothetical protein [Ricinus communis]